MLATVIALSPTRPGKWNDLDGSFFVP